MAGGNWNWTQNLTAGEVQWPTGPLPLADPTEVPTSVVAWVVQSVTIGFAGSYAPDPQNASSGVMCRFTSRIASHPASNAFASTGPSGPLRVFVDAAISKR